MYCSFSTRVVEAMEYGITILLMSNALLLLFFRNSELKLDGGMECDKGTGLVVVGVGGEDNDTTVGRERLLARFCNCAAVDTKQVTYFILRKTIVRDMSLCKVETQFVQKLLWTSL